MHRTAPFAAALLLAAAPHAARAAEPAAAPPSEPTFFEVIDVRVVNVEVVVTDHAGQPVPGLAREDFELLEDGRPVQIDYFYAESAAPGTEAAPPAADPAISADTLQPAPVAPAVLEPSPEQRLHVGVFIDDQSLTAPARNRLLPSLRRFLGTELGRGDRLLLARYDGSLTVQQPPVGSSGAIEAALDAAGRGSARGSDRRADLAHLLRELQGGQLAGESENDHSEMDAAGIYAGIRMYSQTRYDEVRRTLGALSQVVDALAGLPGRKALLYVGGGLSLRPGEALYRAFEGKYGRLAMRVGGSPNDILQHDATPLLRDLAARANAGRVTVYAIGAPEDSSSLALEQRLDPRAMNTPSGGINWSTELAASESFNLSQPLQMMAGPTGGVAAFDTPNPGALLATVRRDLSSYYSLGFVPSRRDGDARRLEVRVKRSDLRVRHREGYREATGRERAARGTRSAIFLGWSENPLEAAVEVEGSTLDRDGQLLVDLLVKVPLGKLVLLPQADFHEGRLTVFVGARDRHGRTSDLTEVAIPIRVPNDQLLTALGQVAGYRARLRLRPIEHLVAVGVRDELGNVESTATTEFRPEAAAAGSGR